MHPDHLDFNPDETATALTHLPTGDKNKFRDALAALINSYSMENGSDTPDFILASYLATCLDVFDTHVAMRDSWNKPSDPDPVL